MKKNFLFLLLALCLTSVVFAQSKTLNNSQKGLRDGIYSFLKSEGYQPTIDSDGDISFKRQGAKFFVIVSDTDDSPMFVQLQSYYLYGETWTHSKVLIATEELNRFKMLKVVLGEKSFHIDMSMFLTDAKAFTSIFDRVMRAIDALELELADI